MDEDPATTLSPAAILSACACPGGCWLGLSWSHKPTMPHPTRTHLDRKPSPKSADNTQGAQPTQGSCDGCISSQIQLDRSGPCKKGKLALSLLFRTNEKIRPFPKQKPRRATIPLCALCENVQ